MLKELFSPQSIAVVGASRKEGKVGHSILKNLVRGGYRGKIFPVNPRGEGEIFDLPFYPTLSSIPETIDMVMVAIPREGILPLVEEAGRKKTKLMVIITAGFKETGKEGKELEERIKKEAKKRGIRILGPNVLGIINTHFGLNASFAPSFPFPGNISFFSQSGALGTSILDWASGKNIGISKFISLGNKADLDEIDILKVLREDKETEVILGYVESIERGEEFLKIAKETTKEKPLVMLKSGTSEKGKKAASSHTGALAGEDEAYEVAFRKTGIIRAHSLREFFNLAGGFSQQPSLKGRKICILTNAGGPGIMATDACEKTGLELVELAPKTKEVLREFLPPAASLNNPVDILGDADAERYRKTLETVIRDEGVNGILVILTPQAPTQEEETARIIGKIKTKDKTIITSFLGGERIKVAENILLKEKVPNYDDPQEAVKVLGAMAIYGERRRGGREEKKVFSVKKEEVAKILEELREEKITTLGGERVLKVMEAYGIPVVQNLVGESEEEVEEITSLINSSLLVMKIESPHILHKSEVGGVAVGIEKGRVREIYQKMVEEVEKKTGIEVKRVSLQPLVRGGKEVLIGSVRDRVFGPLVRVGWGGKYVEIVKDYSTRLSPLTLEEAESMVKETKILFPLLQGVRGETPSDIELVMEGILRISKLMEDFPSIQEVEANPFTIWEKGGVVIDARISLNPI